MAESTPPETTPDVEQFKGLQDISIKELLETLPKNSNEISLLEAVALVSNNLSNLIILHESEKSEKYSEIFQQAAAARSREAGSLDVIGDALNTIEIDDDDDEEKSSVLTEIPSPSSEHNSPPKKFIKIQKTGSENSNFKQNTPNSEDDDYRNSSLTSRSRKIRRRDGEHDPSPKVTQRELLTRRFYLKSKPSLDITQYIMRIEKYCKLSVSVYLSASYYIHKLSLLYKLFPVTELNVYRLVLSALRISTKLIEDLNYRQSHFARAGGLSVGEMFKIEISFLFLCDFNLVINEDILYQHLEDMKTLQHFLNSSEDDPSE